MCIRCHRARSVDGFHCAKCQKRNKDREARAYKRERSFPKMTIKRNGTVEGSLSPEIVSPEEVEALLEALTDPEE